MSVSYDDISKLAKMAEKSLLLPEDELISFVKNGAIRAYKAGAEGRKNEEVSANFDAETKQLRLSVRKLVVAAVLDKHKQCTANVANAPVGSSVDLEINDKNTDKAIMASYAALRELVANEWHKQNSLAVKTKYQELKGKCVPVKIVSNDGKKIGVQLSGGIAASMPQAEQTSELYEIGNEIIVVVKETTSDSELIVSRTHAALLSYSMHRNIPEVDAGNIEVKATARVAGKHCRAAVWSEDFSPIERCSKRIEKLKADLGQEKIDFVEWYSDIKAFIVSALRVEALKVHLLEKENQATVEAFKDSMDENLDAEGIGIQLAEELTGYKIEIKPVNREGGNFLGV